MMVPVMADLLASERFHAWTEAVNKNPGWVDSSGKKSNEGLVRILGVYYTSACLVAVIEKKAMSVALQPAVRQLRLEFNQGLMSAWSPEGLVFPENSQLWIFPTRARQPFQFSCDMDDGSLRWVCITSCIGDRCGPIGWDGDPQSSIYRPWEHLNDAGPLRDNGVLVGRVGVHNIRGEERFFVAESDSVHTKES